MNDKEIEKMNRDTDKIEKMDAGCIVSEFISDNLNSEGEYYLKIAFFDIRFEESVLNLIDEVSKVIENECPCCEGKVHVEDSLNE